MSIPQLTIIPAGAGSGKTFTIQNTLAKWVRDNEIDPDRIVAVTFTEAAAAELRGRIREQLVKDGRLEDALRLDQAYISTIHGFGLRLLTEFAFDAGISPAPRLLNEDEEAILIRQALAETDRADGVMGDLDGFGYRYDFTSKKGGEDLFRDRVLELINKLRSIGRLEEDAGLLPHALQHLKSLYGPTELAQNLNRTLHDAVLALLAQFPAELSSLHSDNGTFVRALRADFQALKKAQKSETLETDWQLWKKLRKLRGSKRGTEMPEGYDALVNEVIDAADALPQHPGPLAHAVRHVQALLEASQDCLGRYAQNKREKGLVDYTDMVALSHRMLVGRPEILETFRQRVDCLVIDEFQDTNPLQFSLLWALCEAGVPTLVVGDLKQAIMGFQNADSRLLAQLQTLYPEDTQPLTGNWRSTAKLMDWFNAVGQGLFKEQYTALTPHADYPSSLSSLEAVVFGENWRAKAGEPSPTEVRPRWTASRIKALLDDPQQQIYDRHQKITRRLRAGDIAILCPTNKKLSDYADALRELGVCSRREAGGWFESPVVRLACHALAYVADPCDRHAALVLAVTEMGEQTLQSALSTLLEGGLPSGKVFEALRPLKEAPADLSVSELLNQVIDALDLYGVISTWPEAEQARASLLRLQGEAQQFMAANREALASGGYYGSGPKSFLAWLTNRAESENGQPDPRVVDEQAVVLMTWHKSKGKEWPVVVVAGSDAKVKCPLPSTDVKYRDFSDLGAVLEQARIEISPDFAAPETGDRFKEPLWEQAWESALCLLYVVITRAREKVILEWPQYLDNGRERSTVTFWEVLTQTTGMTLDANHLKIGRQQFDCRVMETDRDLPPEYDTGRDLEAHLPTIGLRAIEPGLRPLETTPEIITPSSLHAEEIGESSATVTTTRYSTPLEMELDLEALQKGTLLHRCFELFDGKRDVEIIRSALGDMVSEEDFERITQAAGDFYHWLDQTYAPLALEREVPILFLDEKGSVVNGFIDLLVETEQGFWIIDHKSDRVEDPKEKFNDYLPQLRCYAAAVAKARPDKPVLGIAINWIVRGEVVGG